MSRTSGPGPREPGRDPATWLAEATPVRGPLEQEVGFCTTPDGVRLAYATMGEGPPLVKAANWLSHIEFDRYSPVWRHVLAGLSSRHTLIRYDERGCGLSDREVEDFSFDAWVRDLETVVDALGLETFDLLGISQGGPVAIAYVVCHPERVRRLVLYGAYARGWTRRLESPEQVAEAEAILTLTRQGWGRDNPAYRQIFTNLFCPDANPEQVRWFNELQRVSASPENAVRFLETFGEIDVRDLLHRVTVPTLVLHARREQRVPLSEARSLADGIPGARLVTLDSRNHILLQEEPAWGEFLRELHAFLGAPDAGAGRADGISPERWSRIQEIFHAALEWDPDERARFVAEACGSDAELRREVESLLGAHEEGGPLDDLSRDAASSSTGGLDPHEALHAALGERYELEDVLGEGGMGTVYLARDRRHGRPVAIKTVHPDLAEGEALRRFEREIRVTAGLQHPHILPLMDSGVAGGVLYYIMPYVEGESLQERLARDGSLPLHEAVRIGSDILEGLAHAHARGVIHRDIKPANILLGERHAVLTDFGIAKAGTDAGISDPALTRSGMAVGTPRYMAPEQLSGVVDPRSDIYALGAVLYEALSGRRWTPGVSAEAMEWGGVPSSLRPVLRRALRTRPEDRWPDAASFRRALRAARGRSRRLRWARGAAVALVAALLVLGLVRGVGRSPAPSAAAAPPGGSIAVLPFANLTGGEANEYFSDGITDEILTSLAKIGGLRVISRTSVMPYKNTEKSLREIGQELGVATILEGSVRREGDRVRITAQLLDARTDEHLWAETYDRELSPSAIFEIQGEIAREIAAALETTLTPEERRRIERSPPTSLDAYDLYLKGTERLRQATFGLSDTRQLVDGAVLLLREALGLDPRYAPAYAALSEAFSLRILVDGPDWADSALAAARTALAIDPELPEAHVAVGNVHHWKGETREALASFRRALEINPGSALANSLAASALHMAGRWDEALPFARRAAVLEPTRGGHFEMVGRIYQDLGLHDRAARWYHQRLRMEPDNASSRAWLAYLHMLRGEDGRAAALLDTALAVGPTSVRALMMSYILELRRGNMAAAEDHVRGLTQQLSDRFAPLVTLGYVLWKQDRREQAERLLERAERRSLEGVRGERAALLDDYVDLARIHAIRGDVSGGLRWLEEAIDRGWVNHQYARIDPRLENLGADPAFGRLMGEMEARVAEMRRRAERSDTEPETWPER